MILFAFLSILSIYLLLETMERLLIFVTLILSDTIDGILFSRATMVAQVERERSMSILELRRYFTISNDGEGRRVSESNPMVSFMYRQVRQLTSIFLRTYDR